MQHRDQQPNAAASTSTTSAAATTAAIDIASVPPKSLADFLSSELAIRELVPWLDNSCRANLARISHRQHNSFFGFADVLLIPKLAHYIVVKPNPNEIITMIKANPALLQCNIKQVKVNNVILKNNTPFQLAYGAGDGEMCMVLKEELIQFLGSEDAAVAKLQEEVEEKKLNEMDQVKDNEIKNQLATELTKVIQAISNEQFDAERDSVNKWKLNLATLTAIAAFRTALTELQPKVVEEGMHFRSNTLQETLDAYAQAAEQWDCNYAKCALFEDGVLSFVLLSCVPVNDKQRFSQGLYHLYEQDRKERFARCMTVRGTHLDFDACMRAASLDFSGLSGSCIDIMLGARRTNRSRIRPRREQRVFESFCQSKTFNLQSLCSRADQHRRPAA